MKLINKLKKKNKGNFGDVMGSMVAILLMIMLLAATININSILETNNWVNIEARRMMLTLEQNGTYIGDIDALTHKFEESGLTVNFNINDNRKSEYGQNVFVEMYVSATGEDLDLFPVFGMQSRTYTFNKRLESISKAGRE